MMARRPPVEPAAEVTEMAATWRQVYQACINQGFSISQSMDLLKTFIASVGNDDDTPEAE